MTRYEKIKSMSKSEMRTFLCDLWLLSSDPDTASGCETCPMQHKCHKGHTGWIDFLNEEWDNRYSTGVSCEEFDEGGKYGKQSDSDDFF